MSSVVGTATHPVTGKPWPIVVTTAVTVAEGSRALGNKKWDKAVAVDLGLGPVAGAVGGQRLVDRVLEIGGKTHTRYKLND